MRDPVPGASGTSTRQRPERALDLPAAACFHCSFTITSLSLLSLLWHTFTGHAAIVCGGGGSKHPYLAAGESKRTLASCLSETLDRPRAVVLMRTCVIQLCTTT